MVASTNSLDKIPNRQLQYYVLSIAGAPASTTSRDQGWVGDPSAGNWTWFELAIRREDGSPRLPPTGIKRGKGCTHRGILAKLNCGDAKQYRWNSHYNRPASYIFEQRSGRFFDTDHALWRAVDFRSGISSL